MFIQLSCSLFTKGTLYYLKINYLVLLNLFSLYQNNRSTEKLFMNKTIKRKKTSFCFILFCFFNHSYLGLVCFLPQVILPRGTLQNFFVVENFESIHSKRKQGKNTLCSKHSAYIIINSWVTFILTLTYIPPLQIFHSKFQILYHFICTYFSMYF